MDPGPSLSAKEGRQTANPAVGGTLSPQIPAPCSMPAGSAVARTTDFVVRATSWRCPLPSKTSCQRTAAHPLKMPGRRVLTKSSVEDMLTLRFRITCIIVPDSRENLFLWRGE